MILTSIKSKITNKKLELSDKTADFLSRFLIAKDFDMIKSIECKDVENQPTVAKAQPIVVDDEDLSNVEDRKDVFVIDENGNPLKFELESFDSEEDEIILWVYNKWVRDGSVQAKILFGNCQHPRVSKWIQKLRVYVYDDSAVGVFHLEDEVEE